MTAAVRITRITADPADAEELLVRRADLIAAARAATPGPAETQLVRVDESTYIDVWRWESVADKEATEAAGPALPAAAPAFALVKEATVEWGELLDVR